MQLLAVRLVTTPSTLPLTGVLASDACFPNPSQLHRQLLDALGSNICASGELDLGVSFAIALGISITIVSLWAWLGDWSQSRTRKREDEYWAATGLKCPNCEFRYEPTDLHSRWTTFSESAETGASIRCPRCLEIAEFEQAAAAPRFIAYAYQHRICCNCGDRHHGSMQSACPTCGSKESRLAPDVASDPRDRSSGKSVL